MQDTSATPMEAALDSTFSKWVIIMPVNVAEIIRISSHGRRFFASVTTLVLRYSSSEGSMAAIFSKSSVFSSSMTSTMSSTVMMPTRRSS